MRASRALLAAILVSGSVVASAAPATAERLSTSDPAGDTPQPGLDITRAAFANGDRAIVTRLTFRRDRPGTVVVKVKARHGRSVYIVSEHLRTGPDDTFLFEPGTEGATRCRGLASSWDREAALLRLRMPARCLDDGNYGAVRHWALTETRGGGDVDAAPQDSEGELSVTDWIPRG
jgi:hypothetical protein